MEETSFEVYQGSKLKKLMELIKFAMQVGYIIMLCCLGYFWLALLVNFKGYLCIGLKFCFQNVFLCEYTYLYIITIHVNDIYI